MFIDKTFTLYEMQKIAKWSYTLANAIQNFSSLVYQQEAGLLANVIKDLSPLLRDSELKNCVKLLREKTVDTAMKWGPLRRREQKTEASEESRDNSLESISNLALEIRRNFILENFLHWEC